MTPTAERPTAKIYQFPQHPRRSGMSTGITANGRTAPGTTAPGTTASPASQVELAERASKIAQTDGGSGWYHSAAIQDAAHQDTKTRPKR
jgi:hypothetical protein